MENVETVETKDKQIDYKKKSKKELIDRINYLEIENEFQSTALNTMAQRLSSYQKGMCPIYPEPSPFWREQVKSVIYSFVRHGDREIAKKEAFIHTDEEFQEILRIIYNNILYVI